LGKALHFEEFMRESAFRGPILPGTPQTPSSRKSGSTHEMMVASPICLKATRSGEIYPLKKESLSLGNKMMYICFVLTLVMLAASPTCAADADSNASPQSYKTVVKVDSRTGKLVRTQVAVHPPAAPAAISELVKQTARAHDVDPLLVDSVIRVESNYNPNAVSPKGAEGLMQLMPPTARMMGVDNSFDPAQNIEAGVKYLKYLQDLYKDDRLALAAYNAGPGAVDRFKNVPPYPETQKYVESVGKKYGEARSAAAQQAAQNIAAPAPAPVPAPLQAVQVIEEEKHPRLEQFVDADGRLHLRTSP
jgi:hypothetical protein